MRILRFQALWNLCCHYFHLIVPLSKGHFTHETESPWPWHLKHSHWWKTWTQWSKFASTLLLRDPRSMWMQRGCQVYMDSYMVSNGSCFMVTWTIFKNHLVEVGLTQNQETMALRAFTTVDLFYFIMREDPHEQKCIEIALGWGLITYDFALHLRVRDHTTWFWRCVGTAFWHVLLGSHNFMVTALGSCVKRPYAKLMHMVMLRMSLLPLTLSMNVIWGWDCVVARVHEICGHNQLKS